MSEALQAAGMTAAKASLELTGGRANNRFTRAGSLSLEEAEFVSERTGFRAAWLIWGELPARPDPETEARLAEAYRAGFKQALEDALAEIQKLLAPYLVRPLTSRAADALAAEELVQAAKAEKRKRSAPRAPDGASAGPRKKSAG